MREKEMVGTAGFEPAFLYFFLSNLYNDFGLNPLIFLNFLILSLFLQAIKIDWDMHSILTLH